MKTKSNNTWWKWGSLALVVLGFLGLSYQIDRQWAKLALLQDRMTEQNALLRDLSQQVSHGVTVTNQTNGKNATHPAFARAKAAQSQDGFSRGDWLVKAFATNLKTISPLVSTDIYASKVQGKVLETLLTRNPDTLEWQGLLAESWQISDDGLQITFYLRDGVHFSDGKPLTSADVLFSFDFMRNEGIKAPGLRAYFEKVSSVTTPDEKTVVFTFSEPYFKALAVAGSLEVLPKHFYQPFLEAPEKYNESKGLLLGSGPYRLIDPKGWTPDKGSVELVRNERYWGPVAPNLNRLVWSIIQNDSARLTTFRNGDIDVYDSRAVEFEKLKQDRQLTDSANSYEYMSPVAGYSYLAWNQQRGGKPTLFADKRVRQAMTMLTDRQRIIDEIYLGYAEIAVSPFSPRSKQHNPDVSPWPYDLERGKALLAEVGYEDRDGDGVLESSDGQPFRFELTYFEKNDDTKRMVLLLKDLYAKAGVELVPTPQEWPVMLEALNNKNFDAITLGWSSGVETDIYQMFHSSQTKTNGDNFVMYQSDQLDTLIDQARGATTESERMPIWQQAEAVMHDEQPYTFLFRRKTLAFFDKRIKNLQMTKLGLNSSFAPQEFYVPLAEQRYTD